jgi:hypothetical protein
LYSSICQRLLIWPATGTSAPLTMMPLGSVMSTTWMIEFAVVEPWVQVHSGPAM